MGGFIRQHIFKKRWWQLKDFLYIHLYLGLSDGWGSHYNHQLVSGFPRGAGLFFRSCSVQTSRHFFFGADGYEGSTEAGSSSRFLLKTLCTFSPPVWIFFCAPNVFQSVQLLFSSLLQLFKFSVQLSKFL